MKKLIEIKNISKSFGKKQILKDISFDIYEHDQIALIGANGSGKSTLIEIILQTLEKTSGEVIYHIKTNELYKVFGVQFQEANYPSGLKVKDIIGFFTDIYNVKNHDYIEDLWAGFKLNEIKDVKVGGLSGGQLQRLNIMLALIHKPKILILDEITNGLDIQARSEIKDYIKKFVKDNKLTLIMISHNVEEIAALANRVLFLNNGVIENNQKLVDIEKEYGSIIDYTSEIFGGKHD